MHFTIRFIIKVSKSNDKHNNIETSNCHFKNLINQKLLNNKKRKQRNMITTKSYLEVALQSASISSTKNRNEAIE